MLRKNVYPLVEPLVLKIVRQLNDQGISPNQLTLGGLALTFLAGWIFAAGQLFIGGLFLILASLGDMLDGPLARETKKVTKFGAFLDSTVDRYADFFIFVGLAIHYVRHTGTGWFLVVMGILMGSFVTSYAKARAENLIKDCSVGYFGRAERIVLVALGALIPFLMPFLLWVLLIGTNATAIQRILYTRNALLLPDQPGISRPAQQDHEKRTL
ncbi:MAG: hypothetical protein A2Z83_00670 [Omnitrophica bacterium GWA2_52_8]|nr:MAG: hypothetical protein A2Z83_00670 [Omnitrophica bacterium GWA2_52_8]